MNLPIPLYCFKNVGYYVIPSIQNLCLSRQTSDTYSGYVICADVFSEVRVRVASGFMGLKCPCVVDLINL